MPSWVLLTGAWTLVVLGVAGVGYAMLQVSGGGSGFLWHVMRDTDEEEPDIEDEAED